MELEDKITLLEYKVRELETKVAALEAVDRNISFGSRRAWTKEQLNFIASKFFEDNDIDFICNSLNDEFGPKGYVERTAAAVACQLYKIIEHSRLPANILTLAKKYVK